MKALSMMQPYAWLFAHGILKIDDRGWPTNYRGPVAIHASKKFHGEYYEFLRANTNVQMPAPRQFDFGGIVGFAELTDCLAPAKDNPTSIDLSRSHFGGKGFYGFVLQNPRPTRLHSCRGNLGLWDVDLPEPSD